MRLSRQNKILELIQEHEIETQEQLQDMLTEAGYNVTQATISRDIKDLQLVKGQSKSGSYKYVIGNYTEKPVSDRFIQIFRLSVISITDTSNLIIIKTLPGCGNAAAEAIDSLSLKHVVGTVSGDNTMLLVVDEANNVPSIISEIKSIADTSEINDK